MSLTTGRRHCLRSRTEGQVSRDNRTRNTQHHRAFPNHAAIHHAMISSPPEIRSSLRPYHVPTPTISPKLDTPPNATSRGPPAGSSQTTQHGLGSSARDLFSDIDYSDYISEASPSFLGEIKSLLDEGLWKYTSVLMAQPFDLAKVILQVQDISVVAGKEDDKSAHSGDRRHHKRQYDVRGLTLLSI